MTFAIQTDTLVKKFRRVEALQGLTMTVPRGAVYALVGPNGAGKTTAIKILMNIIHSTSGRAEVLGIDSHRVRGQFFESIGYVSENQELPEWMTVAALLNYLRPFYPAWDPKLEAELIRQFELPADRKLRHLSRGMRMKASLASSLAYHPKLIVLDEPFTGLDPLVRDELIQGLLDRAEESTIFISSHDLGEIETFASHVAYLEEGKLRFAEEMTSLISRFREVELTFDAPPTMPQETPKNWLQMSVSSDAFASLAGVAPIPASSGQTRRMRLARGGNRQLNRALYTIALAQLWHHPPAKAYIARKRAEGKTWREAMRCLKRHLARHVFELLQEGQGVFASAA